MSGKTKKNIFTILGVGAACLIIANQGFQLAQNIEDNKPVEDTTPEIEQTEEA
ncbi:MAG: hypothetical protein IKL82_00545 [Clostridia bacterium]|nr:hypothetical protein [Clostridia bacterium]